MSQRKSKSFFILLILFLSFATSIFISGFVNAQRAEHAHRASQYKAAAEFYAQAATILFWQNNLWEKAGIASAHAQDYSTAIFYFQKVNKLSEQGWAWLGASYFQTNNIEKAILTFENGLKEYQTATLYRALASAYRAQKNWEAEKNALERQIVLDAQDAYAHYRLGILLMTFSPATAYDALNRASILNVETASAVDTLTTALNIANAQNNYAEKYVTIGRALGLVQAWDLAFVAFQKAIAFNHQNAEAWAWLGEAKQQQGQNGRAELDKALLLNHTSAPVRGLRALYWKRQEKYTQMLAEYLLAHEFEPTNPAWLTGIGEAYAHLGDLIAALQAYQQAVELAPTDPTYWRLLAMFCAENNFYIEEIGLPSATQAVSLSPNDPEDLDTLGYVYFLSGRYSNAELTFLQVIDLSPQYFPAHLHLALTYLAQNNRAAAYHVLTFVRDADNSGLYRESAQRLLNQYFP